MCGADWPKAWEYVRWQVYEIAEHGDAGDIDGRLRW
jgi:hypothetical protein